MADTTEHKELASQGNNAKARLSSAGNPEVRCQRLEASAASHGRSSLLAKIPSRVWFIAAIAFVAIGLLAAFVVVPFLQMEHNKGRVVTGTQLKELVDIDQLSTAEIEYEGIAVKRNDAQEPDYYVRYTADVKAYLDMEAIDFDIDQESKTVAPLLPELVIGDPALHTAVDEFQLMKVDRFIFTVPDPSLQEEIELCQADAASEAQNNQALMEIARDNARKVIEGLTKPLLSDAGYTLVWPSDSGQEDVTFDGESADVQSEEG